MQWIFFNMQLQRYQMHIWMHHHLGIRQVYIEHDAHYNDAVNNLQYAGLPDASVAGIECISRSPMGGASPNQDQTPPCLNIIEHDYRIWCTVHVWCSEYSSICSATRCISSLHWVHQQQCSSGRCITKSWSDTTWLLQGVVKYISLANGVDRY